MIDITNENSARVFLLLEMAFQTKRCVAFVQQALVDGAVGRMADGATLTHRLVRVNKRAALLRYGTRSRFRFGLGTPIPPALSFC